MAFDKLVAPMQLTGFVVRVLARLAQAKVQEICQAHGLIVRNLQDTIALCPPLIITEAELDEVLKRFELALIDTTTTIKL